MTMITPSYLGETIEYSSLHACRSTLEDPTRKQPRNTVCRDIKRWVGPNGRCDHPFLWFAPVTKSFCEDQAFLRQSSPSIQSRSRSSTLARPDSQCPHNALYMT